MIKNDCLVSFLLGCSERCACLSERRQASHLTQVLEEDSYSHFANYNNYFFILQQKPSRFKTVWTEWRIVWKAAGLIWSEPRSLVVSRDTRRVSRDIVLPWAAGFQVGVGMARNEEKQQGRLNRLWLQKEREGKQPAAVTQNGISAISDTSGPTWLDG